MRLSGFFGWARRAAPWAVPGVLLALALWAGPVGAAPLAGAIFTTTPDGGIVNENTHYLDKREVYLDGGPGPNAPQTAAGLPDGLYVFQVTNPSGAVLLSEDPAKCRVVEVADGVIVRLVPPSDLEPPLADTYTLGNGAKAESVPCHAQDGPDGAMGASGRHDTNTDLDHGPPAIVVQLMPYYDTPNPGGVYKAWMMPLGRYLAKGGDLDELPSIQKARGKMVGYQPDPGFRPPRDQIKTDNFKVKEAPPALTVRKFHDLDGDGHWDEGEPEIGVDECVDATGLPEVCDPGGGWRVFITEPLWDGGTIVNERFTPVIEEVPIGEITVEEDRYGEPPGWMVSYIGVDGAAQALPLPAEPVTATVNVLHAGETHEVIFGNYLPGSICGRKFHDLNGNGIWDTGEPGREGVQFDLTGISGSGQPVSGTEFTDSDGRFCFHNLSPGVYDVTEVVAAPWASSTAISAEDLVIMSGVHHEIQAAFGNLLRPPLCGGKFEDRNGNGAWDDGEPGVPGVTITLTGEDGMGGTIVVVVFTDATGRFCIDNLWPGLYTVTETVPEYSAPSTDTSSGPHEHISMEGVHDLGWVFGNFHPASLCGKKYEDLDASGSREAGELGLEGVTILLTGTDGKGNTVDATTVTAGDGGFCFLGLPPGTYTVTEDVPEGYLPSTPTTTGEIVLESDDAHDLGWVFGNYRPVAIEAHKFFDANTNGLPDPSEASLSGITLCLTDEEDVPVAEDAFGNAIEACQVTEEAGMVFWLDLAPGTYTVTELLPWGFFATTPVEVTVSLASGDSTSLEFGNVAYCDGLTPGYWKNWRNHYTADQFKELLQGTIALDAQAADEIFEKYNASEGMELTILRAMLLANQLTMNLTYGLDLPNPSGGSLYGVCQVPGVPDDLAEWLARAVAIHEADGVGFSREEILMVKTVLDRFANLHTGLPMP